MRLGTLLTLAAGLAISAMAQEGRLRPPEKLGHPRDKLTSFTGKILSYTRGPAQIVLRMRTDEDTTERFVLRYPKGEDPSRWFLPRAEAFRPEDWKVIESERGRLRTAMRATVRVCEGGGNPVLDWEPPPKR